MPVEMGLHNNEDPGGDGQAVLEHVGGGRPAAGGRDGLVEGPHARGSRRRVPPENSSEAWRGSSRTSTSTSNPGLSGKNLSSVRMVHRPEFRYPSGGDRK